MSLHARIERGFEAYGELVVRRRWWLLLLSLAVAAGAGSGVRQLVADVSFESFLHSDDPVRVDYDAFRERFGREDSIVVTIETADVFVQNFRPGAADRMRIGEDVLRAVKPDLIYVSISGFGETGPYAHKRVYDPVIQALSGLATIQGDRGVGRPKMMRVVIPDKVTAMTAAQAITAALLARERTGEGQHVRLSMLDAMISLAWPEGYAGHTFVGSEADVPRNALAQDLVFETKDGYMTAGAVSDSEWQGLTRALDHPEWLEDERFKTAGGRVAYAKERLDQTADVLRERTTEEWLERLDAEQVPCAPILPLSEILRHPQIEASGVVVETDHPVAGRIRQTRAAARFEKTPTTLDRPAPTLGEHTDEILAELGLAR